MKGISDQTKCICNVTNVFTKDDSKPILGWMELKGSLTKAPNPSCICMYMIFYIVTQKLCINSM